MLYIFCPFLGFHVEDLAGVPGGQISAQKVVVEHGPWGAWAVLSLLTLPSPGPLLVTWEPRTGSCKGTDKEKENDIICFFSHCLLSPLASTTFHPSDEWHWNLHFGPRSQGSRASESRTETSPMNFPAVGGLQAAVSGPTWAAGVSLGWATSDSGRSSSDRISCQLFQSCLLSGPLLGLATHCRFPTNSSARLLEPG